MSTMQKISNDIFMASIALSLAEQSVTRKLRRTLRLIRLLNPDAWHILLNTNDIIYLTLMDGNV